MRAFALALGLFFSVPAGALAHELDDDKYETVATVGTAAMSLTQVGFLVADLYHATNDEFLPGFAAWTQTILLGAGSATVGVLNLLYHDHGVYLGLAITDFVLSAWFFTHGVLSIMHLEEEELLPTQGRSPRGGSLARTPRGVSVALAPMVLEDGGGLRIGAVW